MPDTEKYMLSLLKKAVAKRGIKIIKLPFVNEAQILSRGKESHLINLVISEKSSHLGMRIAKNKYATTQLLKYYGLPVPRQKLCTTLKQASAYYRRHKNIVVKPVGLSLGWGVTVSINNEKDLAAAVRLAIKESQKNKTKKLRGKFLLEEKISGRDYRVSVINFQRLYAVLRTPAYVFGDGKSTITQLIKKKNQKKLAYKGLIKVDSTTKRILKKQGYTLGDILPRRETVFLKEIANICAGGESQDVTAKISPFWRQAALKIAKIFNLPAVGIDIISPDIAGEKGKIIEVNGRPHLILHHHPHLGHGRDPIGDLVDSLFSDKQ